MQLVPFYILTFYYRFANELKEISLQKENLDEFFNMWTDKLRATNDLEQIELMHFVVFFPLHHFVLQTPPKSTQVGSSSGFILCPIDFMCVANRVDFLLCCSKEQSMLLFLIHRALSMFAFFMYLNF